MRLAAWVYMVFRENKKQVPNLDPLLRLRLVDKVGFPYILDVGGESSLLSCDSFSRKGDYSDLHWIADTVEHG